MFLTLYTARTYLGTTRLLGFPRVSTNSCSSSRADERFRHALSISSNSSMTVVETLQPNASNPLPSPAPRCSKLSTSVFVLSTTKCELRNSWSNPGVSHCTPTIAESSGIFLAAMFNLAARLADINAPCSLVHLVPIVLRGDIIRLRY